MDFQDVIARRRQILADRESVRLGRKVKAEEIGVGDVQAAIKEGRLATSSFLQDFCIVRYGCQADDSIRRNFLNLFENAAGCLDQPVLLVERVLAVQGGFCQSQRPRPEDYKLVLALSLGILNDHFIVDAHENCCGFPVNGWVSLSDLSPAGQKKREFSGEMIGGLLSPLGRDLGRDLNRPLSYQELALAERLGEPPAMLEALIGFSEIQTWAREHEQFVPIIAQMCAPLGLDAESFLSDFLLES